MPKLLDIVKYFKMAVIGLGYFLPATFSSSAQNSWSHADSLVKGVYMTYHEFKRNQPSYTGPFEIIDAPRYDPAISQFENVKLDRYRDKIRFLRKGIITTWNASKVFGYCDGDSAYVSDQQFHAVRTIGLISLVRVKQDGPPREAHKPQYLNYSRPLVGFENVQTIDDWYILNLDYGGWNPIHSFILNPIFRKWDKEVYKLYRKSKNRNELKNMIYFINLFNERNPIPN